MFVNGEVDPWRASSIQKSLYEDEPVHLSLGTSHQYMMVFD
jgi:hypothetical protein